MMKMPDPKTLSHSELQQCIVQIRVNWDKLIVLSAQWGKPNIMWLDDYLTALQVEDWKRHGLYTTRQD